MTVERLAEGGVEGVDGAVPFGHLVVQFVAQQQLDRGLGGDGGGLVGFDVDVES